MENNFSINEEPERTLEILDNSDRAKWVMGVFVLVIAFLFVSIYFGSRELTFFEELENNNQVDYYEEFKALERWRTIIGFSQFSIVGFSVVVVLYWFRRAYGNLHRLGNKTLQATESMAVWVWFIPVLGLFRPMQIMKEIWLQTQLEIQNRDSTFVPRKTVLITVWWTLYIVSNFLGNLLLKRMYSAESIEQSIKTVEISIWIDMLHVPEALILMWIVFNISKMERRLASEIASSGGNVLVKM